MALQLDLKKAAKSLRLSLDKAGIAQDVTAEVIIDIDVSGSFEDEHEDGTTELLLTRLVPWGLTFDPDRKLDVFTFSNGAGSVHNACRTSSSRRARPTAPSSRKPVASCPRCARTCWPWGGKSIPPRRCNSFRFLSVF